MKNSGGTSRFPGIWTKSASPGRDPAGRRTDSKGFTGFGWDLSKTRRESTGSGRDGTRKFVPREIRVSRIRGKLFITKTRPGLGGSARFTRDSTGFGSRDRFMCVPSRSPPVQGIPTGTRTEPAGLRTLTTTTSRFSVYIFAIFFYFFLFLGNNSYLLFKKIYL